MTDWPPLALLLLTYEDGARSTAEPTLRAALDGIRYSGDLTVHIADDGSVEGHVERLREIAGGYPQVTAIGVTNAARRGYGRSFNLATQAVHLMAQVVLPLEDDWLLTRPLDLDPLVATLMSPEPAIACIRLGYLGFTQSLRGRVVHTHGGPMLLLDEQSPEPHVFSGHPRLETVAFERSVGPWPEGLAPGATEFAGKSVV